MREIGVVESTNGVVAIVSVKRSTACGDSCATCSSQCRVRGNKITVGNKIGAMPGDLVAIEMKTSTVLRSAFLVYILPILMLFAGYFVTEYKTGSETKSLIAGLLAFGVAFIFLLIWDKINKEKFVTSITDIIEKRN